MRDLKPNISIKVVVLPVLFVMTMWLVYWIEVRFHLNFNPWGVYPRRLSGLMGILFGPFIHGSLSHLWHNTVPILVLTSTLLYFYDKVSLKVFILGYVLTGLLTWIIGRASLHIGASGIIYMLAGFLFFKGLWVENYRLAAVSFMVVFLYGSLIWGTLPYDPKISWEGHLSGFISGIVLAAFIRNKVETRTKYAWEREDYLEVNDPFMRHFDEDGNFIAWEEE